jgi:hypothetical protein
MMVSGDAAADYMGPSVVVMLETAPFTPNGKVDQILLDPFISSGRTSSSQPPCTGVEQQMAQTWSECWQLERIGANDNFFEVGVQSLVALRLAPVEREMGRMDPRSLFFQMLRQVSHVEGTPVSGRRSAR